jgi:hypothetical protein
MPLSAKQFPSLDVADVAVENPLQSGLSRLVGLGARGDACGEWDDPVWRHEVEVARIALIVVNRGCIRPRAVNLIPHGTRDRLAKLCSPNPMSVFLCRPNCLRVMRQGFRCVNPVAHVFAVQDKHKFRTAIIFRSRSRTITVTSDSQWI